MTTNIQRLLLISDDPTPFVDATGKPIATDASAEWEDAKTIVAIAAGWKEAGWSVESMTVTPGFLSSFSNQLREPVLVHSLTEGWGSKSREAWIPSICELAGVPWVGSTPFGLAVAMDKDAVSAICHQLSVPSPKGFLIRSQKDYTDALKSLKENEHFIKPNAEGSGMGIDGSSLRPPGQPLAMDQIRDLLRKYPDGLRVEPALRGPEYTAALIGSDPEFLPIAQIEVEGGIYGIEHKQKDAMTERVLFPQLSLSAHITIRESCFKVWDRLQLRDFSRFDWKCDEAGNPYLIDINPLAGLSPYYSVLPKMWEKTGRHFSELLATIGASALEKITDRCLYYGKYRAMETPRLSENADQ